MYIGFLLVVSAGLLWGLNGIVFSYIARKSIKFAAVIGIQVSWGSALFVALRL